MKKGFVVVLSFAAFVLGCALTAVAPTLIVPPAAANPEAQRWEYFCYLTAAPNWPSDTQEMTEKAKEAGLEGWEMTSMISGGNNLFACFKRPL